MTPLEWVGTIWLIGSAVYGNLELFRWISGKTWVKWMLNWLGDDEEESRPA